jgi:hypothetical protein
VNRERPDYFAAAPTTAEALLRRVKGNERRAMISAALDRGDTLDSVPADWKEHNLPDHLKNRLQRQHPQARGGEDLPDLRDGEVEIARITLVDSGHGEVISLRARLLADGGRIELSLSDESGSARISTQFLMTWPINCRSSNATSRTDPG